MHNLKLFFSCRSITSLNCYKETLVRWFSNTPAPIPLILWSLVKLVSLLLRGNYFLVYSLLFFYLLKIIFIRTAVGSTSDYCLRNCSCDVLICKYNEKLDLYVPFFFLFILILNNFSPASFFPFLFSIFRFLLVFFSSLISTAYLFLLLLFI